MRARGIVLALGGAREFGDALLEDGVASRFALECGARPLVYHALRAIARASRYACEKITVVCEGDAHAAIVRECASAWALEWGTTPTIEVTAVDEGAGGGDALAAATRDDEAAEMKDTALIVVNGDDEHFLDSHFDLSLINNDSQNRILDVQTKRVIFISFEGVLSRRIFINRTVAIVSELLSIDFIISTVVKEFRINVKEFVWINPYIDDFSFIVQSEL